MQRETYESQVVIVPFCVVKATRTFFPFTHILILQILEPDNRDLPFLQ